MVINIIVDIGFRLIDKLKLHYCKKSLARSFFTLYVTVQPTLVTLGYAVPEDNSKHA